MKVIFAAINNRGKGFFDVSQLCLVGEGWNDCSGLERERENYPNTLKMKINMKMKMLLFSPSPG